MPALFLSGDLFATPKLTAFAHGCNCAGSMGAGIAREFRSRWPDMYLVYRDRCERGTFALGDVFVWEEEGKTIFNLGTQQLPSMKADVQALETALLKAIKVAEDKGIAVIGMPRVAAGLGGLDWTLVREIIERIAAATPVTLAVFEEFRPYQDADIGTTATSSSISE
jgi:O-acetyl-ADP-ribose deacetylase (regulator of RNase III)